MAISFFMANESLLQALQETEFDYKRILSRYPDSNLERVGFPERVGFSHRNPLWIVTNEHLGLELKLPQIFRGFDHITFSYTRHVLLTKEKFLFNTAVAVHELLHISEVLKQKGYKGTYDPHQRRSFDRHFLLYSGRVQDMHHLERVIKDVLEIDNV